MMFLISLGRSLSRSLAMTLDQGVLSVINFKRRTSKVDVIIMVIGTEGYEVAEGAKDAERGPLVTHAPGKAPTFFAILI